MIYFFILFFTCLLNDSRVGSNLYSNFEKNLDEITNYVKKKVDERTSSSISQIYQNTENLFRNPKSLNKDQANNGNYEWSSDDLYEIRAIKKLMELFPPYQDSFDYDSLNGKLNDEKMKDLPLKNDKKYYKKTVHKRDDSNTYQLTKGSSAILNSLSSLYPNVVINSPIKNVPTYNPEPQNTNTNDLEKKIREIQNTMFPNMQTQVENPSKSILPDQIGIDANANNKLLNLISSNNLPQIQNDNIIGPSLERLKHMDLSCNLPLNDSKASSVAAEENRHLTRILDKVLNELQAIRQCKTENKTQNGGPCDITGSWNSEIIGLRFDIIPTNDDGKDFSIRLKERYPKKRHTLIQPDWKSSGSAVHKLGGPFFMTSKKCEENTMATFAGLCKTCGGIDMIFGTWTFVRPAKDCEDVQVAIENRRDVFRRSLLAEKKKKRLQEIRRNKL